ncbi:VOC family protein [Azospirillum sp.]|uniref:VOC family protein n=1 Tax=Azospirillum sp. TaxID=34012 RepID=UPI002D4A9FE2|nr:VOC family protein [Azospirillum sp.]HYD66580.1 VOC family protein [Azospirillum sp.]
MIDHISLPVSDIARARAFYDAVLATVGYKRMMDFGHTAGYGEDHAHFWIGAPEDGGACAPAGVHVAFRAPTREAVDAFHAAALAAGGADNGAPGLRPRYHPFYYAGFVIDPDGNRIEAVCHTAP